MALSMVAAALVAPAETQAQRTVAQLNGDWKFQVRARRVDARSNETDSPPLIFVEAGGEEGWGGPKLRPPQPSPPPSFAIPPAA